MNQDQWDRENLESAYERAKGSCDPSTQNGAILRDEFALIIGYGINEFPKGVLSIPNRWERPLKYSFIEHAERNAIFAAARKGLSTYGSTLFCPWSACTDCARAIIQAGVKRLVRHTDALDRGSSRPGSGADGRGAWDESILIADQMLREAGVRITNVTGRLTSNLEMRMGGQVWTP